MEQLSELLKETEANMKDTIAAFKQRIDTLNAGRANPDLLNNVKVDAYGSISMLSNLCNVSAQDARTLIVNVWDKSLVSKVDSAIRAANLGFNPVVDGNILKIYIPTPTEERRKELAKLASNYAEDSKTAQKKTHRRTALDKLEEFKEDLSLSEDDIHNTSKKIEAITNRLVLEIDEILKKKIKELETI